MIAAVDLVNALTELTIADVSHDGVNMHAFDPVDDFASTLMTFCSSLSTSRWQKVVPWGLRFCSVAATQCGNCGPLTLFGS